MVSVIFRGQWSSLIFSKLDLLANYLLLIFEAVMISWKELEVIRCILFFQKEGVLLTKGILCMRIWEIKQLFSFAHFSQIAFLFSSVSLKHLHKPFDLWKLFTGSGANVNTTFFCKLMFIIHFKDSNKTKFGKFCSSGKYYFMLEYFKILFCV